MIYIEQPTTTLNSSDMPLFYGKYDAYLKAQVGAFSIQIADSDTKSVRCFEKAEPELIPFECARLSGSLDFWNNPEEDVYTSEDGQPI